MTKTDASYSKIVCYVYGAIELPGPAANALLIAAACKAAGNWLREYNVQMGIEAAIAKTEKE